MRTLLAMKGFAVTGRHKQKDAYDIYYCIRNFEGGPAALAKECQALLDVKEGAEGFKRIRDFFAHLLSRENGFFTMPGTFALVALRNERIAKARTAHATADRAFYLERDNQDGTAGPEWQSLFGTMIPMFVA